MSVRILIIDTYYPQFLRSFYADNALRGRSYDEQWRALMDQCFGTADYYSANWRALGWEAAEVVADCEPLQRQWAREHGLKLWHSRRPLWTVLREQIRSYQPDILYIQNVHWLDASFLRELRPQVRLVVGQIAACLFPGVDYGVYDLLLTSLPHYVGIFRTLNLRSEYVPLAFESTILSRLGPAEKKYGVVFVGGFTGSHARGLQLLENMAQRMPVNFWGYGVESLSPHSPIRRSFHGAAWGLDMYRILAQSKVVLNRHAEFAGRFANNMRLFEATGVGACLTTEVKDNLGELFEPDREVAVYRDEEECAERVQYLLGHDAEREAIAKAGQSRTLRQHTFQCRIRETAEILESCLRKPRGGERAVIATASHLQRSLTKAAAIVRPVFTRLPHGMQSRLRVLYRKARRAGLQQVSDAHRAISDTDSTAGIVDAWKDPAIPSQQRRIVQSELLQMYLGEPTPAFLAAADAIRATGMVDGTILEVGCASGYYCEVLGHLLGRGVRYVGLDFSHAMVARAREAYPAVPFIESDACNLALRDESFDVVLSGCVLLCLHDYERAIREAARVARYWCVFHRTPIVRGTPTTRLLKNGYGVEMLEFAFNEAEVLGPFAECGLTVSAEIPCGAYDLEPVDEPVLLKTYVCRKRPAPESA